MEKTVATMKALSDRNRLRIFLALQDYEELCACQITELLEVSGATASKHLGILQKAGLIQSRKDGKWTLYRLLADNNDKPLLNWLNTQLANTTTQCKDSASLKKILAISPEEICRKQRGEACSLSTKS